MREFPDDCHVDQGDHKLSPSSATWSRYFHCTASCSLEEGFLDFSLFHFFHLFNRFCPHCCLTFWYVCFLLIRSKCQPVPPSYDQTFFFSQYFLPFLSQCAERHFETKLMSQYVEIHRELLFLILEGVANSSTVSQNDKSKKVRLP